MAIKPLNSIAGFSTGDPATTIIQSNGDITTVNFTANGISNLGANGNIVITGGSNGQALTTDGNGVLSWSTVAGEPGGNDTFVQYNSNGSFAGDAGLTYDAANTLLTANNLLVSTQANLGSNTNVIITGGSTGQALITDGAGNLSWGEVAGSQSPAPMPIRIDEGNVLNIPANYQGLFGTPLIVDGTLEIDGVLIDVSGQGAAGSNSQITFNDEGNPAGNNGFTFNKTTGNMSVPGSLNTGTFVRLAAYSKSELNSITGVIGQIAVVSNSNPIGLMAFWDATNNRWSYVYDNSAV